MVFSKKWLRNHKKIYYIFWYILMSLCYVESLSWFWAQIFELWPFLKIGQLLKNTLYYSPWFFPKNGSEITKNFYYIFWYILMSLCYVESLSWFWAQIFELWPFLKIGQFLKNTLYYSPCFFPKNCSEITKKFCYIFWYILMSLCYVESLSWFRLKFFELWPFLKSSKFSEKSMDYSPWFFPKNGSKITPNFYYIFWYILMSLLLILTPALFTCYLLLQMLETNVFDDVNKLSPLEAQRSKSLDMVLEEEEQESMRQRTASNSFFGKFFRPKRQVTIDIPW